MNVFEYNLNYPKDLIKLQCGDSVRVYWPDISSNRTRYSLVYLSEGPMVSIDIHNTTGSTECGNINFRCNIIISSDACTWHAFMRMML